MCNYFTIFLFLKKHVPSCCTTTKKEEVLHKNDTHVVRGLHLHYTPQGVNFMSNCLVHQSLSKDFLQDRFLGLASNNEWPPPLSPSLRLLVPAMPHHPQPIKKKAAKTNNKKK